MATEPSSQFAYHPGKTIAASGHADAPIMVEQLSDLGMVFQSRHPFPLGTQLAIGLHVCNDCGGGCGGGHFLMLDGFVVDCRIGGAAGAPAYSVTLLFDGLSAADQEHLRQAIRNCAHQDTPVTAGGAAADRFLAFGPN